MTEILRTYPPGEAAELAGFKSVAMLDYLQRSGVFHPTGRRGARGRGKQRRYEFRDILVLKALKRLLDSGASVANLKRALSQFQKTKWSADPVTLEGPEGVVRYLIANGESVYLVKDAETLVDLSRSGQMVFSFIIDLEVLRGELRTSLGLPDLQHELDLILS